MKTYRVEIIDFILRPRGKQKLYELQQNHKLSELFNKSLTLVPQQTGLHLQV